MCCGESGCVRGGVLDGLSGGADGDVMYERFTVVKSVRRCDDSVGASVVDDWVRVGRVWESVCKVCVDMGCRCGCGFGYWVRRRG